MIQTGPSYSLMSIYLEYFVSSNNHYDGGWVGGGGGGGAIISRGTLIFYKDHDP